MAWFLRRSPSRSRLQGIAILGISLPLGVVFLFLPVILTWGGILNPSYDPWPDLLPWLLLLLLLVLGCIGLLRFRRWAAVLLCGLGWGWLVYVCYVEVASPGLTVFFGSGAPLVTVFLVWLPLAATLLLTVSMIVSWPRLKNGL